MNGIASSKQGKSRSTRTNNASAHPLFTVLSAWERRYYRVRALQAAPYALLGLLLTLAGGLLLRLPVGTLAGACALNPLAWGVWWGVRVLRPLPAAARHWDTAWGLQERLSTALELLSGRISAPPELTTRQLTDALRAAQSIDAGARLQVRWGMREGALLLMGALCLLLAGVWAMRPVASAPPLPAAALAQARDALADALTELANDTRLTPDTRADALETLQTRLDSLNDSTLDLESAFGITSAAAQELRQLSERAAQAQANAAQPLAERILETLQRAEETLNAAAQTFRQADDAQRTDDDAPPLPAQANDRSGDTSSPSQANASASDSTEQQGSLSQEGEEAEGSQAGEGQQGSPSQEGEEAGGSQAGAGQADGTPQAGDGQGDAPAPPDALASGESSAPDSERGGAGSSFSTTNPDGEGEGAPDLLFLPVELPEAANAAGDELRLAGERGDMPSSLVPLELPVQGVSAPYSAAFARYAAAAANALDNPTLPQGVRAFIRAYFDRLRP